MIGRVCVLVRATVVSNTELHINTIVARIPWPVRTALNGGGRFHLSVGRSGEKGKTAQIREFFCLFLFLFTLFTLEAVQAVRLFSHCLQLNTVRSHGGSRHTNFFN